MKRSLMTASSPRRVLLVEDHLDWRAILEDNLKALGLDRGGSMLRVASSFEEASKALRQDGPWNLLVSDMGLGGDIRPPLGIRLAEVALEKRVPTLVVSGTMKMTVKHVSRLFTRFKIAGFHGKDDFDASAFRKDVRNVLARAGAPLPPDDARRGRTLAATSRKKKQVLVLHGRNPHAVTAVTEFLRALGLSVWTFKDARDDLGGSPYTGAVIRNGMEKSAAILVLFTPDEKAALKRAYWLGSDRQSDKQRWQARPNVLFEAGMALGIDERRTILVVMGSRTARLSNVDGRQFTQLDNRVPGRRELRGRLRAVGCDVDMETDDWRNYRRSGDFEKSIIT